MKRYISFYFLVCCIGVFFTFSNINDANAVVKYVTNDYDNHVTLSGDTSQWANDVAYSISHCGYNLSQTNSPKADSIMNMMQNKEIFVWCGHGGPGKMSTANGIYNVYAKNATKCIEDDIPNGSMTNQVTWFIGCEMGATDSNYGNLLDKVISKSDYGSLAIGSDIPIGMGSGRTWNYEAWVDAANGSHNVTDYVWEAADQAGQGDYNGFDSTHVCVYGN